MWAEPEKYKESIMDQFGEVSFAQFRANAGDPRRQKTLEDIIEACSAPRICASANFAPLCAPAHLAGESPTDKGSVG
jgi:hypothetical protein